MMTEHDILQAVDQGECRDWEFKSAAGGLPASLWDTYSAMANSDGGTIVLGIEEREGQFRISGLPHPQRTIKDFWNTINNRGKVSTNLLTDQDAHLQTLDTATVMVIQVPRAARRQRPVFVGQNPLLGTYRRNHEGDYRCSPDEVGRLLADQAEEPADARILPFLTLEHLDLPTIQQYRQLFAATKPDHPWLLLDTRELLIRLGGWRKDWLTGDEGITIAGVLMFGKDDVIRDPAVLPQYHVDYREKLSADADTRWDDRLVPDGTWEANVFQFYQQTIRRLIRDLKVPFQLDAEMHRIDHTPVHEALREAVVNAVIHADYRGVGGVIISKLRSRIEISNPGTLLISYEQLLQGGISECRNKSLQRMFQMIGGGEKAGSGIDRIRQGWASQGWRFPELEETVNPDRVQVWLPMESLLPEEVVKRLATRFGARFATLTPLERETLVTADVEGRVSNSRLRMVSDMHAADLTRLLQSLVTRGFLTQVDHKRWAYYLLADATPSVDTQVPPTTEVTGEVTTEVTGEVTTEVSEAMARLLACCRVPSPRRALMECLNLKNDEHFRKSYLVPALEAGYLEMTLPQKPQSSKQMYRLSAKGRAWLQQYDEVNAN